MSRNKGVIQFIWKKQGRASLKKKKKSVISQQENEQGPKMNI